MPLLQDKYELREVLGEGGMGVVYRAFDLKLRREVALKTIRDVQQPELLDLFLRECEVLKHLQHPNVIELYDIGEFEEGGASKPYFVMPLLRGAPLSKLLASQPQRLTPERVVAITTDALKGLHAAHEQGLIHRDIKPSNIFVMEDDTVKLIDFGVAHLADVKSSFGAKGTIHYMAPEQLDLGGAITAASDIFSMGVVCFELLTRQRPFRGATLEEVAEAIRRHVPPPVSELNPSVNPTLSRVIHAAMAKQPWHRFSTAREFAGSLQKALLGQTDDRFDASRLTPRLQRVRDALEQSEYELADERLGELEGEGHDHPEMRSLRRQVDQAMRTRKVRQYLQDAQRRLEQEDYQLALEKVHLVLQIDPENQDALTLRKAIESERSAQQVENWLRLANQHLENFAFQHAREALDNVLKLDPTHVHAMRLREEVGRREQEYARMRLKKEQEYESAVAAWNRGDVSSAFTKIERVLDMENAAPEQTDVAKAAAYRRLFDEVRSEQQAIKASHAEARKYLDDGNYDSAQRICNSYLEKYPGHPLFQALCFDIAERRRQDLSAFIAKVDRDVHSEPDLRRKMAILERALEKYPGEPHFEQALKSVAARWEHIESLVAKARNLEERGQFTEGIAQWEIVRSIYSQYPGLDYAIEALGKRREQQARLDHRQRVVEQMEAAVQQGDFARAQDVLERARQEFPEDPELALLEKQVREGAERAGQANELIEQGRRHLARNDYAQAHAVLEQACQLSPDSIPARALLTETLTQWATAIVDSDWQQAEERVRQALDLDPGNPRARALRPVIADRRREFAVNEILSGVRQKQSTGDVDQALEAVERGLGLYPKDWRLMQAQEHLRAARQEREREAERRKDLDRAKELETLLYTASPADRDRLFQECHFLRDKYPNDVRFQELYKEFESRVRVPEAPPARAVGNSRTEQVKPVVPVPELAPPRPRSFIAGHTLIWGVLGAAMIPLLILGLRIARPKTGGDVPSPTLIQVFVDSEPGGAEVYRDGRLQGITPFRIGVLPGAAEFELKLDGYEPERVRFDVAPGVAPAKAVLRPLQAQLRVMLTAGTVTLNGTALALQDGLAAVAVEPGTHTLEVRNTAGGMVRFGFLVEARKLPAITTPVTAAGMRADVVTTQGPAGRLHYPRQQAIEGLAPGAAEVSVPDPAGARTIPLLYGENPMVHVVVTDLDVGTLSITSQNGEGATIYVNGTARREKITRGQWSTFLAPGRYAIRVAKQDFEDFTREVEIRKGVQVKQAIALVPRAQQPSATTPPPAATATLRIQYGTPEAEVAVDGRALGRVAADGSFNFAGVATGQRKITLSRRLYESKELTKDFSAGGTVEVAGMQAKLVPFGRVVISRRPADTRVTYMEGGKPTEVRGSEVDLKAGDYVFTAQAEDVAETYKVNMIAGGSADLPINLEAKLPPRTMREDWLQGPRGNDGGWLFPRDSMLLNYTPAEGRVTFLARRGGSLRKRVRWLMGEGSAAKMEFDLRDDVLEVKAGGKSENTPHKLGACEEYRMEFQLAKGSGALTINCPGRAEPLRWQGSIPEGKFGIAEPTRFKEFVFQRALRK